MSAPQDDTNVKSAPLEKAGEANDGDGDQFGCRPAHRPAGCDRHTCLWRSAAGIGQAQGRAKRGGRQRVRFSCSCRATKAAAGFDDQADARASRPYAFFHGDRGVDPMQRPVTFVFNGGPGASSAWQQLGNNGPWRLPINADAVTPSTAPHLKPNAETWL